MVRPHLLSGLLLATLFGAFLSAPQTTLAQPASTALHPVAAAAAQAVQDEAAPFVMAVEFKVLEGKASDFITAMADPRKQTLKEAGNRAYALNQDPGDAHSFLLYEHWTNVGALDSHLKQPYLVKLSSALGELLAEPPTITYYTPID